MRRIGVGAVLVGGLLLATACGSSDGSGTAAATLTPSSNTSFEGVAPETNRKFKTYELLDGAVKL